MTMTVLRAIKDRIPLSTKLKVRFYLHNALSLLPRSERVRLRVRRVDGYWKVSEHSRGAAGGSIAVTSFRRWVRFDRGIDHQLTRLARHYGAGRYFEIARGDQVIDIGANVGEFSLHAARAGARVLAVEADAKVAAILRENARDVPAIEVVNQPIWSKDEVIELYSSPDDAESSLIRPSEYDQVVRVEATRLDTLAAKKGIGRVKLIKCDAEGAEPEVLGGASDVLARTEWVSFDCGPEREGKPTLDECRSILVRAGFEIVSAPVRRGARVILVGRNTRIGA
jgi:FkbM family methyltransferase